MSLNITITDKDLGLESKELNHPTIRMASRGIVINKDGKIAVMHKRLKNEYKLPGGGVENDEDMEVTFQREVLEETGCRVEIIECLGTIEEKRMQKNFKQISYVYVAKVTEDTNAFHLTKKEEEEQMELVWLDIEEALEKVSNCYLCLKPSSYGDIYYTKFAVARDRKILENYKEMKKESNNDLSKIYQRKK